MDLNPVGDFIAKFGLPLAMLLIGGITGARGQWLFRWVHDAIVALLTQQLRNTEIERDDWKGIALGTLKVAEKTVTKERRVRASD